MQTVTVYIIRSNLSIHMKPVIVVSITFEEKMNQIYVFILFLFQIIQLLNNLYHFKTHLGCHKCLEIKSNSVCFQKSRYSNRRE